MPEPSLEAPADPLPAPAASGDGAKAEPEEGSEPAEVTESIPAPEDFVRVADWIPDIYTDLRYAADNNFTGQAIYDFSDAYLRYGTVEKLAAAHKTVAESGCSLLIWDAFRPASAQFRLWEICPDPAYVANPEKGFSSHSRGNTVDVTLVATDGQPVDIWDESPDDSGDDSDYDYGYDYDYRPGFFWRLTHTVPPFGWLIILGIPALIALIVCLCMKRSMKTAVSSGNANMYIRPDGVRLTRQNDIYTHTTVTRTQNVPDDDHNNSGGGGTTVNSGGFSSSHGKF